MASAPPEALSFAHLLRQRRRQAGLTQQDLAQRSGVSARAISDLERGINRRPQRETAAMLAGGLGLSGGERERFLETARRPSWEEGDAMLLPLPTPAKPLLGREDELRAIEAALADDGVRVLTLTGPGGVGKTRLAMGAAHRFVDRFSQGIAFVRLEGLSDPDLVIPAIVSAFQLRETGSRSDTLRQLAAYLATHDVLVVLDNLEHLLDAARELAELVALAPNAKFLITSRESPRIGGERVLHVPPLSLSAQSASTHEPDAVPAAIQVFLQTALDRSPNLDIDPATREGQANLASIAEICHRLDGLPLAIELAAAQTEVLSPAAILSLLKAAGLPLLTGGNRDQPARLQTMEAAIGWSYTRLLSDERAIFRALAVFAGGFTLAAAERVAAEDREGQDAGGGDRERHPITSSPSPTLVATVASLARQNLVIQDSGAPDAPEPRFRMLEPLRLFALDRLRAAGEESLVRRRHATYFEEAAEALDELTLGPNPEIWFEEQARELDNFRAALDWALANNEHRIVAHIVAYVAQFWLLRGLHAEGRQRLDAAIAIDSAVDPADRWFLRFWATIFAFDGGDVGAARGYASELLEIAEAAGDQIGVGAGLTLLSQIAGATPEGREEAVTLARSAVEVLEPLGHDVWTASAWARLGIEYQHQSRLEEARDYFLRSLALRRRASCEGCTVYPLVLLGGVHLALDRPREAVDAFRECLVLAIKHGNKPLTIRSLLGLAEVTWRLGADQERARYALRLYAAAEAVRRRHGFIWDDSTVSIMEQWKASIREEIGDTAVEQAIDEGSTLSDAAILELVQQLSITPDPGPGHARREVPALLAALGSIE